MLRISGFCILVCMLLLANPVFGEEDLGAGVSGEDAGLAEDLGEGVITGEVSSIDTTSNAITIKSETGAERTFSVIDGETIIWKGIEDITLSDINKGQEAEVGYYTDDNGTLIASWVDVLMEEEPVAPPMETEEGGLEE